MTIPIRGDAALELTGMVSSHAEVFAKVANGSDCVILSRAVGIYATGLLEENYASKGFHNKAKSCNWGPMAGFVLNDPRFTKVGGSEGGRQGQAKALDKAFDWGAEAVPVYISERRRRWLMKEGVVRFADGSRDVIAGAPWGSVMRFRLLSETPLGANEPMWGLYYHPDEKAQAKGLQVGGGQEEAGLLHVMAMRDPFCAVGGYRSATTGDYDLFAVFPPKDKHVRRNQALGDLRRNVIAYDPAGMDGRPVPGSATGQPGYSEFDANEFTGHKATDAEGYRRAGLGNITPRIIALEDKLNAGIRRAGYTGGDLVHHSDEAGRPMVNDVDMPVIGFVPGDFSPYGLQHVSEFKEFVRLCSKEGYHPMLNPGWLAEMGYR